MSAFPHTLPVAVNPESDLRELARVLGLPAPARIEGFDISTSAGRSSSSMVSFWQGRPDRSSYQRFRMKSVTQQDDFASMAETIRDGGNAALTEMRNRASGAGLLMMAVRPAPGTSASH